MKCSYAFFPLTNFKISLKPNEQHWTIRKINALYYHNIITILFPLLIAMRNKNNILRTCIFKINGFTMKKESWFKFIVPFIMIFQWSKPFHGTYHL